MGNPRTTLSCINCEKSQAETPLLRFTFQGDDLYICSSCLPILIHKPDRLADRLAGAERIEASQHSHH
jgi:hypothetical protein